MCGADALYKAGAFFFGARLWPTLSAIYLITIGNTNGDCMPDAVFKRIENLRTLYAANRKLLDAVRVQIENFRTLYSNK